MKGVTSKLKLAKSQRDWQAVSCQICLLVQQLAEALHRLRTVCTSFHSNKPIWFICSAVLGCDGLSLQSCTLTRSICAIRQPRGSHLYC